MMRLRKKDVLVTKRTGVDNDAQHCQILSFLPFFSLRLFESPPTVLLSVQQDHELVQLAAISRRFPLYMSVVVCQYQQGENEYHQQSCCRDTVCWISTGTEKTCHSDTSHAHKSTHCSITAASHTLYTHKRERKAEQVYTQIPDMSS